LRIGGCFRSYYFTRQNASNNPGAQFTPGPKYSSNGVNQASWNSAIAPSLDYNFPGSFWHIGGSYLYANPMDGPCVVPANHVKGAECASQIPPNTNADDTLPGFTMSTFYQSYLKYVSDEKTLSGKRFGWDGTFGLQLFDSPWANAADSRLKPAAFAGGDLGYTTPGGWTFEGADMLAFENRTSSDFSRQTLLTSYPAGNNGLPSNINAPGGLGINTNGFTYAKLGYAPGEPTGFSAHGFFYNVADLVNMWWFDGKYAFSDKGWAPYLAMQGGREGNGGQSYIGKVDSQVFGAQLGAKAIENLRFTAGYDEIPWKTDTVNLPAGVTCNKPNYQIKGALAYFLPLNAAQCYTNGNGTTQIEYGGWASPYTDGYDSDPLFTTSVTQGMADRRAPGTSWQIAATFTWNRDQGKLIATDAWYNYGNALAPESTKIWVLDGQYHFRKVDPGQPYHGLLLRYRYAERTLSNTYCGAAGTSCPPGLALGSYLGGLPIFKYNRAQLEFDF
jgi:hypothetical protein